MKRIFSFLVMLVTVIALAAPASAQEKTIKRKVAIGRFTNETQYGKGLFYKRDNDPMRKQAIDILTSKLANSGKFILLERDDLDVLESEKGEDMNKIDADFIILGSITEFGRKNQGEEKVFSTIKTQTVEAGVSIRLVDAATSLVIYSDEAKGFAETTSKTTLGLGGTTGYDATLSDKAISSAISQLVENIINKCMDKQWKAYILSAEDGEYIMSGGASQGIAPGDTFFVYKKGKVVKNPQTGMNVELPGSKIGTIKITQCFGDTVETEMSFCSYTGTPLDPENLDNYYVSDK
jgi:Uncharacterized protein involved in formation of curli polymers